MKKLFLLAMIALASVGINAQTVKGEGSLKKFWEYKDVTR